LKFPRWAASIGMIALLWGASAGTVAGQPPDPTPAPEPTLASPRIIETPLALQTGAAAESASTGLSLAPLKAVLIVGPLVGLSDDSPAVASLKTSMDLAAQVLGAHGASVFKFYTPSNDWNTIVSAAQGAQFLFYAGEGVGWPDGTYGGFYLRSGSGAVFISPDQIRSALKLAPNAIVMINACFASGGSGTDSNPSALTSPQAQYRVAQYSDPFFDIGAGGYFADWYQAAFSTILTNLFQGMTLGDAYKNFGDFNSSTLETYAHPYHSDLAMWLDKGTYNYSTSTDTGIYSYAFAGKAGARLDDLFPAPQMSLSTSQLQIMVDPQTSMETTSVQVINSGWSASVTSGSNWLSVLPPQTGSAGASVTLAVIPTGLSVGKYQGAVTVSSTSGLQPQTINVTLDVVPIVNKVYIPVTIR
jgi:hypothetical protein